jgi:hypothetical protein
MTVIRSVHGAPGLDIDNATIMRKEMAVVISSTISNLNLGLNLGRPFMSKLLTHIQSKKGA